MSKYKSALGKVVDMSALATRNEKTRAVGNMKVNARGDTIDAAGNIIKHATAKVNENYARTVGNRSAQVQKTQPAQQARARTAAHQGVNAKIDESELTQLERDLEASMEDDIEVESIKAKETGQK